MTCKNQISIKTLLHSSIANLNKAHLSKTHIILADTTTQLQMLLRDENVFFHRRVKRSLVSECCNSSCTDEVIRDKYCKAPDPEEVGK